MKDTLDDAMKTGYFDDVFKLYEMTPNEISKYILGQAEKEKKENIRAGTIAAAIYEIKRDRKKRNKPYTWKDFFPDIETESKTQTSDQIKDKCKEMCAALGGKFKCR